MICFLFLLTSVVLKDVVCVLNICRHTLETGRLSLASRLSASFQTNQNTRRQALAVPMTVPLAAGFICSAEIVSLDMLSCGMCAVFVDYVFYMHSILEQLFFHDLPQSFILFHLVKLWEFASGTYADFPHLYSRPYWFNFCCKYKICLHYLKFKWHNVYNIHMCFFII